MKRYRFYCGLLDPNGNTVRQSAYLTQVFQCEYVRGFTVFEAHGYWEGLREPSLVIEILCESFELDPKALAESLRKAGNQDAVLWTEEPITAHLETR